MKHNASAWLKLARLQFYPQSLISYSIGVVIAYRATGGFDPAVFLIGFTCVFLIELGTVFCNEYFDYETDRTNLNASLFSGGSRMLATGRIHPRQVKAAIRRARKRLDEDPK